MLHHDTGGLLKIKAGGSCAWICTRLGIDNSCNLLPFLSSTSTSFCLSCCSWLVVMGWLCRTYTDRTDTLFVAKNTRLKCKRVSFTWAGLPSLCSPRCSNNSTRYYTVMDPSACARDHNAARHCAG